MRLIIGIILGVVIVLNWGSIKDYMDNKFSNASEQVEPANKASHEQEKSKNKSEKNESNSEESKSNDKDDVFKKFR